ncbi:hypothetical protein KAJ83_01595 [Marivibrio halodurans]|uniref:Bacteriophage head to tail connecting protein n=1 Tax=Marivibrio halodurans TaxID=2039722 RepID=A0A8J7V130_9PROT|nr:portal protein [Marivibrio halodurans]MBP5855686.1 hypothetical protein [Marivibrio halodurans]
MADTARARYERLKFKREPFLERARRAAELTLPSLLPPDGHQGTSRLPEPYQSLGSRAVVHLSSRLMTALLPPGQPFFKMTIPPEILQESGQMSVPESMTQKLAMAEQLVQGEIERSGWRQSTNLCTQLLVVTGNALEWMGTDNRIRVYPFSQYCVVRDRAGNLLEIVLEEKMAPENVPEKAKGSLTPGQQKADNGEDVAIYTWVRKGKDGSFKVQQEINDNVIEGTKGSYSPDRLPANPLRWSVIPGESYGRGKVEEHIGDLTSFDGLSKAMRDGAAMASRNLYVVSPQTYAKRMKKFLETAENGAVGVGDADSVTMLQFENANGMQVTSAEIQRLEESLSGAFLLKSGLRRDAERVTATELRMLAEELEGVLGGVYSMLSEDMMRVRLKRLMFQMEQQGKLPEMSDVVEPQVVVGLEALGREQDVVRIQTVLNLIQGMGEEVQDYIPWPDLLKKLFVGVGLPSNVRTDEEVQRIRQKRQMSDSMGQLPADAVRQLLEQRQS